MSRRDAVPLSSDVSDLSQERLFLMSRPLTHKARSSQMKMFDIKVKFNFAAQFSPAWGPAGPTTRIRSGMLSRKTKLHALIFNFLLLTSQNGIQNNTEAKHKCILLRYRDQCHPTFVP